MTDITYVTIPEMTAATAENLSDNMLFETSVPDQNASSGYSSKKVTRGQILSALKEDLNNKANVIISSASGSIAHFEDSTEANAVSVIAHIEPVQDLHGYDSPWPAGGGKNLLPKDASGSSNGISFTVSDDGTVTANGTSTATAFGHGGAFTLPAGSYILNGCPSNTNAIIMDIRNALGGSGIVSGADSGNGLSFTLTEETTGVINIRIPSGVTVNNMVFKPMIRLAAETNPTFAPYSNICPISGWTGAKVTRTGKNLYSAKIGKDPFANNVGATHTTDSDELVITMTASTDSGVYTAVTSTLRKVISGILVGSAYTYSFDIKSNTSGNVWCGAEHNGAKNVALTTDWQRVTISVSSGKVGAFVVYNRINVARTVTVRNVQIELGSTATDYEPYQGETYTTDLGGTYYGGTLDVVSGVLMVDRAMIDLGTLNYTYDASVPRFYSFGINTSVKPPRDSDHEVNAISSAYKVTTLNRLYSTDKFDGTFAVGNTGTLNLINRTYTTAADFKSAMSGVQLVYELATPQTIQLTPQQVALLVGTNNVWSDVNGDTDVTYKADTKLYIEQLTKPTEDDMVANTAIQSGKFFMVGNRLFLSTSVIASGDTINPGTNCTELSLADALNNLN